MSTDSSWDFGIPPVRSGNIDGSFAVQGSSETSQRFNSNPHADAGSTTRLELEERIMNFTGHQIYYDRDYKHPSFKNPTLQLVFGDACDNIDLTPVAGNHEKRKLWREKNGVINYGDENMESNQLMRYIENLKLDPKVRSVNYASYLLN